MPAPSPVNFLAPKPPRSASWNWLSGNGTEPAGARSRGLDDVEDVQVVVAVALGDGDDLFAGRVPGGKVGAVGVLGGIPRPGTVGVHDIDLVIAVAPAGKADPLTIRRPVRVRIHADAGRQPPDFRAVRLHEIDLKVAVAAGTE